MFMSGQSLRPSAHPYVCLSVGLSKAPYIRHSLIHSYGAGVGIFLCFVKGGLKLQLLLFGVIFMVKVFGRRDM